MPSIQITAEQAAALARGENVTLTPAKPEPTTYLIVSPSERGSIFKVTTTKSVPTGLNVPMGDVPYFHRSEGDIIEVESSNSAYFRQAWRTGLNFAFPARRGGRLLYVGKVNA
jgi:hypothetical protein